MTWEKQNLVTLKDMSDVYKCSECGYKQKYFRLERSRDCPKCRPENIYGGWYTFKDIGKAKCYHCNYKLIEVPKEGHPNSKFLNLGRHGEVLLACPKNCGEETGIKPGVKKNQFLNKE